MRYLVASSLAVGACTPVVASLRNSGEARSSTAKPSQAAQAGQAAQGAVPEPPQPTSTYDKPPQALLDVLHAPAPPSPYVSPVGNKILLVSWVEYPSIARVAKPFLRLAGVRVEPENRSNHDTPGGYGIRPCARDFTLAAVPSGKETRVTLPAGACPGSPLWSADGSWFAFQNAGAHSVELWVADAATGEAHPVPNVRLNPMLGSTIQWTADQKSLLVKMVPDGQGAPPRAPIAPMGPSIQETSGEKGESSTYEARDTLANGHDEDLFDYYALSQLAVVDAKSGSVARIGSPGLYADVDAAPDGEHVLIETIKRPYSYVTTHERFPRDVAVVNLVSRDTHRVASLPLADRVPVHGVPTGPRDFRWRATEPATLLWAEALDGGDWKVKVPARDNVLMQKAPFKMPAIEVARTEQRFTGITWGETPSVAFLHEDDENRHWRRMFVLDVDDPKSRPTALWDLSTDEKYKHPGSIVYRQLQNGSPVARQDGDMIYLSGQGSSPTGDRPFLDRMNIKTKKVERLYRSDKASLESFLAFASPKPNESSFLTWHQSPTDPPNAFLRNLGASIARAAEDEAAFATTASAVTHLEDPTPAVRAIKKRIVKYKRKDGTDLSFTLYTPPGYVEGMRISAILYAYPLDYADAKKAGQVTGSEQTFTRLRQHRLLLLAGYAIIDNAAFPIVGDPKKAYDTYLEQLVLDAKAAVDKAVELGVVDGDRVGITGHSHGALMTANLLAHSDLFRAGMATSGSYNKTLTPFGFQNERRSIWQAQSVYVKASTFFYADKLKLPILIMHGEDDANPGTTPLQAKKLYEAVRGNGGTARLVMLPHEPHWYSAIESNEQFVSEMVRWFDRYVKNASPRASAAARAAPSAEMR